MGVLTADQIEAEKRALQAKLRELVTAEKIYAKNPAMIGVIRGRTKAIEDRLYYLDRQKLQSGPSGSSR